MQRDAIGKYMLGHIKKPRPREELYDLVITDIKMPQMDGLEVLHRLKEISQESIEPGSQLARLHAFSEDIQRASASIRASVPKAPVTCFPWSTPYPFSGRSW